MAHLLSVFMGFFAVMNPIASSSIFVAMTEGMDAGQQRLVAVRSVAVAFAIIAVFSIGGRDLFSLFGITLPALRIAGGIIIGIIGYHMLQGESSSIHKPRNLDAAEVQDSPVDMAITPLGIPLLAGPGAIATAMNFSAESTADEIAEVLLAFAAVCVLTLLAFVAGPWLCRTLGQHAIKVVTRLMGLILAVIGVQMLLDGFRGAGIA